jgi:hypothetical protein
MLTITEKQSVTTLVQEVYQRGIKLPKQAMAEVEEQINRLLDPNKWFMSTITNPKK